MGNMERYIDTNSKEGLQKLLEQYGSIRAVSRATGVPKSTLQDRMAKIRTSKSLFPTNKR